jgi:DNA replication protein DnaC
MITGAEFQGWDGAGHPRRVQRRVQLASRRYERGSIILTSNKPFSDWGQVLADDVLATAILDRLLHHCDVISINGPSNRLKDRFLTPANGGTMT